MTQPLTILVIKTALLIAWFSSVVYCILSAWCLAAFYRRGRAMPGLKAYPPPVTVLKPVRGADADTYENLYSFVTQDYPCYQVVFGIADADDPAAGVIRRLMEEHPDADIELVVSGPPVGENLKVSNLHYMYPRAKYGILVIADADMRVGRGYLEAVASGFTDGSVGLVTCPYRGAYPEDAGAALEALTIDTDFLPSVAVAERLEGLSFALGATMAVRREALDAIGGFGALKDHLADDYQLGNRVMKAGWRLALSDYVVDSVCRKDTLPGFFSHQLRWGRTYRVSRPVGYFMSVVTKGTAISLLYLFASGFSAAGWAVFGVSLALRYAQAAFIEAALVRGPGVMRWLWLLPVRDIMGFVVWFMSFAGNRVAWKGSVYSVLKDGRMARA